MRKSWHRLAGAAFVLANSGCCIVAASEIELSLKYVGSINSSYEDIGPILCPDCISSTVPSDYHAFGLYMELHNAAANEDFLGVQFEIDLGPGFTPADFGAWVPREIITYDPPGPPGPIPILNLNLDAGGNTNDLVRIIVVANDADAMAANQLGELGPFLLGTAYVRWDGSVSTGLSVAPHGADPWGVFVGGVPIARLASSFISGSTDYYSVCVTSVPEPASAWLAALAGVGAFSVGRRRFNSVR